MSSMNAKIKKVEATGDTLAVELTDGRVISAPLTWYPTLVQASDRQIKSWKPCAAGRGIFWPALDYHLSVDGILRGARESENVSRRQLVTV